MSVEWKKGDRVKVFKGDDKHKFIGEGTITGTIELEIHSDTTDECLGMIPTPVILLDSMQQVHGFQVWWIKVEEAKRIEEKLCVKVKTCGIFPHELDDTCFGEPDKDGLVCPEYQAPKIQKVKEHKRRKPGNKYKTVNVKSHKRKKRE